MDVECHHKDRLVIVPEQHNMMKQPRNPARLNQPPADRQAQNYSIKASFLPK